MMLHIALVAEILATVICIHCIYGRRFKLDISTIGAILGNLIILEIANSFQMSGLFSLVGYVILFIYCKCKFKSSFVETIISFLLCMIILTSAQFIFFTLVSFVIENHVVRNAVGNLLILVICISIFPKCKLHKLQEGICKKSKYIVRLMSFMCLVIMIILLQGKAFYEIEIQYFILVVPAIVLLLYSIVKWYMVQTEADKELHKMEEATKGYEDLLTKVRLRQHEFKNHMAAIFSAHYTHKTYEKLVQVQEDYCKNLINENQYNNLLLLGDNILVGYLYGKFQEVEADGIEINYKVNTKIDKSKVPTYHVIEMLGILLDNAAEALKSAEEKIISFEVDELESAYQFIIKNPYPYVSYDEIVEWFRLEKSEKGNGRGLGLYHLKCLCDEWKCDIECRNNETNQRNWIEFTLKMGKTDNK